MQYLSVKEYALLTGINERTVRNYCASGKLTGAFLTGKTWSIPADAEVSKKGKKKVSILLDTLLKEKEAGLHGGIYHRVQVDLTFNSNHMEGSRLTHEQTRYIYETKTIFPEGESVRVDDVLETVNHFRCIDYVIDHALERPSERMIKELHALLKSGTGDSRKEWFATSEYKRLPNEVGGTETTAPEAVESEIKALFSHYNSIASPELDDLLDMHVRFERIHPFQDGNGRVGRLLLFKECLAHDITPFVITDELKMYYYRGLQEWPGTPGYLRDTCLTAQDAFANLLRYFRIG